MTHLFVTQLMFFWREWFRVVRIHTSSIHACVMQFMSRWHRTVSLLIENDMRHAILPCDLHLTVATMRFVQLPVPAMGNRINDVLMWGLPCAVPLKKSTMLSGDLIASLVSSFCNGSRLTTSALAQTRRVRRRIPTSPSVSNDIANVLPLYPTFTLLGVSGNRGFLSASAKTKTGWVRHTKRCTKFVMSLCKCALPASCVRSAARFSANGAHTMSRIMSLFVLASPAPRRFAATRLAATGTQSLLQSDIVYLRHLNGPPIQDEEGAPRRGVTARPALCCAQLYPQMYLKGVS